METEDLDRFTMRVPANIMIEIRVMAARSRRSINSQVVAMLESAIANTENEKAEARS